MNDQTKAPDRIWLFPQPLDRDGGNWTRTEIEGQPQYIRADIVAEQVREAYERGLDDAAKAMFSAANASVEVFDTEDETDAVDYQLQEGLRILRALKSDNTNGGKPMTPDQYRREGFQAGIEAALNAAEDRTPNKHGGALAAHVAGMAIQKAIRAIDVDEVLAAASAWKGPGETPHRYSPDYMSQGDCRVCGHTREAHQPAPDPVARLVEAARALQPYLDWTIGPESPCYHPTMASALAAFKEALAAMETSHG